MPYTPPATRSPASFTANTPEARHRPVQVGSNTTSLPRSASYLTRQPRRNESWSERKAERTATTNTILNGATKAPPEQSVKLSEPTPPGTSEDLQELAKEGRARNISPTRADVCSTTKSGIISPPESSNSSSDEGDDVSRGRQLDRQIKELQDAISHIPQRRSPSPPRKNPDSLIVNPLNSNTLLSDGMHHSFSTGSLVHLTGSSRRISHTRSKTEPAVALCLTDRESVVGSEDDSDDTCKKPAIVRKKSGELVRPALRPPSRKRPSSMPGTPTFSKNVHFDACLEQVRHFSDIDRPSAVSAASSPVEPHDAYDEFPFHSKSKDSSGSWEIILNNFPEITAARKSLAVRIERVWISPDHKVLMGSVVVANLAYQKFVACRFTLDHWKTVSEVAAEYSSEAHLRDKPTSHDRFRFSIKLSDMTNLESKTLYFCIRYNVNGAEYWDNNNKENFRVAFKKKSPPQYYENLQSASKQAPKLLPLSNRRAVATSGRQPPVLPLEQFGMNSKLDRNSVRDFLGDRDPISGIRLKGVRSASSIPSDNLPGGLGAPSGQAFANRYDFSVSLSAAKQAARSTSAKPSEADSDGLYMKPNRRGEAANAAKSRLTTLPTTGDGGGITPPASRNSSKLATQQNDPPTPVSFCRSGSAITSVPYEEILNKYCFYGSKPGSPFTGDQMTKCQESSTRAAKCGDLKASSTETGLRQDAEDSRGAFSPFSSFRSSLDSSPEREPTAQHHSLYAVSSERYSFATSISLNPSPLNNSLTYAEGRQSSPALGSAFTPLAATPIWS